MSSHPSVVEMVVAHLELHLPLVVVAEMLKVDQFEDPREVPTKLFMQNFKMKIKNIHKQIVILSNFVKY